MRTRTRDYLLEDTKQIGYSFQVYYEKKWCHVYENGEFCIYKTSSERDSKQAELRKSKHVRRIVAQNEKAIFELV